MRNCRLHWDSVTGWILDVPTTVTPMQLHRVAQWAIPRQVQRYRGLPPGSKRDELGRAIDLLKKDKVQQRLIDHDGDGVAVVFASTERVTTREYSRG